MIHRIEISDTDFNLLELLEDEASGLIWDWARIGGCGSFSFDLPREFCNERYISGDFNIKIKRRNPSTGDYDLWYQGLVEAKIPNIKNSKEIISVRGHGYQAQLSRIYLNDISYTSQEISVIVKNILDNYIVGETDITYSAGDIASTGFTAGALTFNTDALTAMQTLADIAGTREWGVDRNRKFYFKARSSSASFYYPLSGKVITFSTDDSFKDIINRIIVQGGDVGGAPYTATFNDAASQLKYSRRDKVIQNSAITTSAVASQLATSYFAEFNDVVRRASCEVIDEILVENTTPVGMFQVVAPSTTYGEKSYGTFLYSGRISYQIKKVNYSLDGVGTMKIRFDLGQPRPSISEDIGKIEYELEQLRSASL